jgi:hypothetical protein
VSARSGWVRNGIMGASGSPAGRSAPPHRRNPDAGLRSMMNEFRDDPARSGRRRGSARPG